MRKYENTRVVVFKEDFNPSLNASKKAAAEGVRGIDPNGRVIYRKGERAAIHHKVLKGLEAKGAKFEVVSVDFKKKELEAKEAKKKALKKLKEVD